MINIVLYEPEIPQNTGNVIRTCVGIGAQLHLIKPLGFSLKEKFVKRAAVKYIDKIKLNLYENYKEFIIKNKPQNIYFITKRSNIIFTTINYLKIKKVFFVFGKESSGIPKEILDKNYLSCLRIPMNNNIRALNLSNCVSIVAYEFLRQHSFANLY